MDSSELKSFATPVSQFYGSSRTIPIWLYRLYARVLVRQDASPSVRCALSRSPTSDPRARRVPTGSRETRTPRVARTENSFEVTWSLTPYRPHLVRGARPDRSYGGLSSRTDPRGNNSRALLSSGSHRLSENRASSSPSDALFRSFRDGTISGYWHFRWSRRSDLHLDWHYDLVNASYRSTNRKSLWHRERTRTRSSGHSERPRAPAPPN